MIRIRSNHSALRVMLTVVFSVAVLCLVALTATASVTTTDTSAVYDFSTYTSNNDAILNGWSVEGEAPEGSTKNGIISVSGGYVGAADYVTREGFGLYENFSIVYKIPAADRINLSEYDYMTFSRKLSGYGDFLVSGARYAIVLTTDKGDEIRVENEWIEPGVTPDLLEVEVTLQSKLEALAPDAKLVKITYIPYVNKNDFRPDTVAANQLLIYFFTDGITFTKAVDMPDVDTVEDTYNELDVLEHNGKITGLDPKLTYAYKLTYETEWKTVTGVSEITGLYGAAYRIYQVADTASGLRDSEPAVASIPKALKDGLSYTTEEVNSGKVSFKKSNDPIIGYWVSQGSSTYNAAGRITVGASLGYLNGSVAYPITPAQNKLEGAFYRRNVLRLDYTLTPEEQIDISEAYLSFDIFCAATFPYLSYLEVTGIMEIYVAGSDEPYILKGLRHSSGDRQYSYTLHTFFPDAEGYIERLVYYPFYNQDSLACYSNNYPQISNVLVKEILPAPKPTLFAIDMEDGNYKISGLKSTIQYEISKDNGETWELIPAKSNSIVVNEPKTYLIRQVGDSNYFPGIPAAVTIKARRPAPSEVYLSGKAIAGLDPDVTYEYAPYSIANDMVFTSVSGVTSVAITEGIWCIRYSENDENFASNMAFIFLDGSSEKGKVNVVAQEKGSSVRGFITGVVSSDVQTISYYTYKDEITTSLVMWPGWKKTTDMEYNSSLNVNYAFESDQAFDIKELTTFYYKAGFQGSGLYLNNGSLTGFYNKVRIHVVGSDVDFYDVYSPWNTTNKTTFNIGKALPPEAHGTVVAYTFFYYGIWPEISSTMRSGSPYPLWTIYDLVLAKKVAKPTPSIRYNSAGNFTIYGLDSGYVHGYSTDGKTFIQLSKGVTSFEVKSAGTYYIYSENSSGMKSELATVEAKVDGSAAVTGLYVTGDTVSGLNPYLPYEYRKYSLTNPTDYIQIPQGSESIDGLTAGVWEIRYVTDGGEAKPGYCVVYGDSNGIINQNALYMADGDKFDGNLGFAEGRWTSSSSTCYLDSVESASKVRLATNWNSSLDQSKLDAFYYSYQLTDNQIVPAADVIPFSFYVGFGNPYPYSTAPTSRVRFYVVGSDVEYYDVMVSHTAANTMSTVDLLASYPDATGYVVALRIWPFATFAEGTTLVDENNRYPVMRINGEDTGSTDPRYMVNINLGQVRPQGIKAERVNENLYQIYKLTGFDADKLYEYSYDFGKSWIALPAGSVETSALVGGTYYVRYAASGDDEASEYVKLITPSMTPAFNTLDLTPYPNKPASTEFIEGYWTTNKTGFATDEIRPTMYVNPTTVLNTVSLTYTFAPEHRFTVSEYPILTVDFNDEIFNLGFKNQYIEGAVASVDVYFTDSTEPCTVTQEWKGHEIGENGSPNRLVVDLISLDKELGARTVRAITIRPYSNISKAPNGFNTSSTASHYIYFRLIQAGFYSTEENLEAIYSETHAEVNTFTEIRIENVPEVVNAGYVIDPDSLLVTALYSNGSEIAVDINDVYLDIPDLEKAGIYILTANYRGKTAKAVVLADIVGDSIELYSGPDKTLYYVGEMFNPEGISVKYMTVNGNTVLVTDDIDVETRLFEAAGDYESAVTYAGCEFKVAVAVIPAEYKLLNGNSDWTLDTDAKRLHGVPEFTTVADIIAGFKSEVAVFDRTGKNITASAEAYVGTGYTVATLMDGEIADYATVIVKGDVNGNGKIDTNDYILIKRAYLGLINVPAGSDTSYAADVNGNGMIDTNDYIRVKNHYRGLLDLFN